MRIRVKAKPPDYHAVVGAYQKTAGLSHRANYAGIFAETLVGVSTLMRGLSRSGHRTWTDFRALSASFPNQVDRLQFLSFTPEVYEDMMFFAEAPEKLFTKFGISKSEFLDFVGFANMYLLFKFSGELFDLEGRMEGAESQEEYQACGSQAAYLRKRIARPQISFSEYLPQNIAKFRELLMFNRSPQVVLAFEYPNYIWISCQPMPQPENNRHGKWVVISPSAEENFKLAKSLLPNFKPGLLYALKFDLFARARGTFATIVYAQEKDPVIREVVQPASGREAFWVSDELCAETQAIFDLLKYFSARALMERPGKVEEVLRDKVLCDSRGISDSQGELLWFILHPEEPVSGHYDFVIAGYFCELKEGLGEDFLEKISDVLRIAFADENREFVNDFLSKQRAAFLETYSA